MKRYDMDFVSNSEYHELMPQESDNGEWVRYDDARDLAKSLENAKADRNICKRAAEKMEINLSNERQKNLSISAERDRYKRERDELLEIIRVIPCQCNEGFTSRKLTDPNCPRCNWIDEDLIKQIEGNENE